MKFLLICFLTAYSTLFVQAQKQSGPEAAAVFINGYIAFMQENSLPDEFIMKSELLTADFKAGYKKLLSDAWEEDIEMGLGFDPVLDAQDYPDKGFIVSSYDEKTGYVTLSGVEMPEVLQIVHVTNINGAWLVDGAGVVNIPESRRVER